MSDRPGPEAERTLGSLLRAAYETLSDKVYGGIAARGFPEIRRAHSSVLRHIAPGGSRLTELAQRAGMAKQSMAYLVEDLSRLGHVESVPDPDDGRARLLRLTQRGRALLAALLSLSAEAERDMAARIGPRRMAALRDALERLARA